MRYIKWIRDLGRDETFITGDKAASLGVLIQNGFNVPGGFCITGPAFEYLMNEQELMPEICRIMKTIDFKCYDDIEEKSSAIRNLINSAEIPEDLMDEILESLRELSDAADSASYLAVRSSVFFEGCSRAGFPGMMDTYHYIRGQEKILPCIRHCWASVYTARSLLWRHQQGILNNHFVIAPLVQNMIHSEVSGILLTVNAVTSNKNEIIVEANWGLGDSLVSGAAIVDNYILGRDPLDIKQKTIMKKNIYITFDREEKQGKKQYQVPSEISTVCTLTDEQLLELADAGIRIEKVFQSPQNIEWAYVKGELFLLQAGKIKALIF